MYSSISFQPVECGHFVAVREKIDGTYCAFRGQILDEIKNKVKIKVFLVDFGDTIEVRERDIRPLPQEFASFPQFAVPCCLKNIEPLQGKEFFRAMFCLLAILIYLFVLIRRAFCVALQLRGKDIVFQFFFVLTQKYVRGYQKSCLKKKNLVKCPSLN